jgi:hypothetical protein
MLRPRKDSRYRNRSNTVPNGTIDQNPSANSVRVSAGVLRSMLLSSPSFPFAFHRQSLPTVAPSLEDNSTVSICITLIPGHI